MIVRLIYSFLLAILCTTFFARSESQCDDVLPIRAIAVSSDNAYIAVSNANSLDYFVQIWNIETGEEIHRIHYPDADSYYANSISFSDDGTQLLLGGATEATLWDIKTGKRIAALFHDSQTSYIPVSAYFVPDSNYIITSNPHGVIFWDKYSYKKLSTIWGDEYASETPIDISHNGKYLLLQLYIEQGYHWQLWNIETIQKLYTFDSHREFEFGRFTPDSKYIVYYTPTSALIQWDIEAKKEFRILNPPGVDGIDRQLGEDHRFRFSPDGRYFALYRGPTDIWNLSTGTKIHLFGANNQTALMWEFLPNNDGILLSTTVPIEKTVGFVWSVEKDKQLVKFETPPVVQTLAVTGSGKYFLLGYEDGSLELWNVKSGKKVRSFIDCHQVTG